MVLRHIARMVSGGTRISVSLPVNGLSYSGGGKTAQPGLFCFGGAAGGIRPYGRRLSQGSGVLPSALRQMTSAAADSGNIAKRPATSMDFMVNSPNKLGATPEVSRSWPAIRRRTALDRPALRRCQGAVGLPAVGGP